MDGNTYNRFNFHRHTFCEFQEVDFSVVNHLKPDFESKSGSIYYFNKKGVYRKSNHWGRAANCKWRLLPFENKKNKGVRIGFAQWIHFYPDNDLEKLYFIKADFETKTAHYFHKCHGSYSTSSQLRTVAETAKRIKQIRDLLLNDAWLKHFDSNLSASIMQQVIKDLIETDATIQQIKSKILLPL